jgi:hypothetical protein
MWMIPSSTQCGELSMPVSIHVADPKAFWLPYDEKNERWEELRDHKSWWFGDTHKFPAWKDLLESLNRVIARHPKTTFVCVHFGNNAEEPEWVDAALSKYPNMLADLAARIPEIGRHDPATIRKLFLKHQDRILFATDFQVYDRLILGSSGNEPPANRCRCGGFLRQRMALAGNARPQLGAHDAYPGKLDNQLNWLAGSRFEESLFR